MVAAILARIRKRYAEGGLKLVVFKTLEVSCRNVRNFFINLYFRLTPPPKFKFRGKKYRYFYHTYNRTWSNERAVEIPIVREAVRQNKSLRVLEVGNVLQNYFWWYKHDVLDKYENARGVINQDVVSFRPAKKYDLIVSISTVEHVGWDEDEREPRKMMDGLYNLKRNCLAPHGKLIVSMPLGYNSFLDSLLRARRFPLETFFMKKISKKHWREASYEEVKESKYGYPLPAANAIVIGVYEEHAN